MLFAKFACGAIGAFLLACASVAAFVGPNPSPAAGGLLLALAAPCLLFACATGGKGKSASAPSLPPMPSGRR